MKLTIVLSLLTLLTACRGLDNDHVILETHKCQGAGLQASAIQDLTGQVRYVVCLPDQPTNNR